MIFNAETQRRGEIIMRTWINADKTYEGFPLFLRRPTDFDIEKLRPSFANLVVVTHKFTKRKPNGLPEDDYNRSLAEMDYELICAFDIDLMGIPALIETFGGERNYYFYVATDADVSATISRIAQRYSGEQLTWSVRPDSNWSFITKYAKEHF
jgi:hypothetical protein